LLIEEISSFINNTMLSLLSWISTFFIGTLTITSPDFTNNGNIPSRFSCEGENISPALHIDGLPKGVVSLVIIVHDPDAAMEGGVTHWIVWNIDPVKDIPQKFNGGTQGENTRKKEGYMGPCPPTGTHHYHFIIYALDDHLNLDLSTNKDQLEKAMENHILAKGELIGLYKKLNPSN